MSSPVCRCCGSTDVVLRGRKRGGFLPREFEFHACRDCELLFVEPFSGFEIYNDAYYRGAGPDPYVDYETEYRDWRQSDRGLEFEDLVRLAATYVAGGAEATGAGSRKQGAGKTAELAGSSTGSSSPRPTAQSPLSATSSAGCEPSTSDPAPSSLLPAPGAQRPRQCQSRPANLSLSSLSFSFVRGWRRARERLRERGKRKITRNGSDFDTALAQRLAWLDFGCGAGGFLKFLRERGEIAGRPLDIVGHDVGSYADLLKRADGFRILDLDELSREPAARYDIISMIEVIEHLPDPHAALALVSRLLKPGGLLLLTTGNLDNPVARRQGIQYRYCAPEIHVSLFNPRCLARLYRSVGLESLTVRYRGVVKFKVVKSLRHRPVPRALARFALLFPPVVRVVDWLYGVSAMPCAVKRS